MDDRSRFRKGIQIGARGMKNQVFNTILDLLDDQGKRDALKSITVLANKRLVGTGLKLSVTELIEDKKANIIPMKKSKKRKPVQFRDRNFPSLKKACDFYKVNYQTTARKIRDGIPLEDIFLESKVVKRINK